MADVVCFSHESLARFNAAKGRQVSSVVCHLWQNRIDRNAPLEIIDNLELHFGPQEKLTISSNADGSALEAIDFDYPSAAKELTEEFGDSIRLFAVDASSTSMWKDVIGRSLTGIKLTKNGEYYLADALVLDFGDEKREVKVGPIDGIVIDYFEE
jgi:hypothetical protein